MTVRKDVKILRQSENDDSLDLPSAESKRVEAKSKLFMVANWLNGLRVRLVLIGLVNL